MLILHPEQLPRTVRAVIFDFDGTLSLIREGWASLMADIGTEHLHALHLLYEPAEVTHARLERQMLASSGQPSIVQMGLISKEILARGSVAPAPEELLAEFYHRLNQMIESRIHSLETGTATPAQWAVPGAAELLATLADRGLPMFLVSGTVKEFVLRERNLLGFTHFFGEEVYAPTHDRDGFQKRLAIQQILTKTGILGTEFLGFGDGFAETVEVKAIGGCAIGVASSPAGNRELQPVKAELLTQFGADAIVPHFADADDWLPLLLK